MKHRKQWLLVADGKQAQAYHYEGPHSLPQADPTFALAHDDPRSREIWSDKPGRMQPSAGTGTAAFTPRTDAHELEETRFLDQVAERLTAALEAGLCDAVILVAPPKALGHLRKILPAAAQKAITHQIDKDLTNVPVQKLAKLIDDHLAA
ncbi:MAG: host attachment protein [Proteobacteria bacterium]|nr:host attachment protein [Pseudomonadota bacterium]